MHSVGAAVCKQSHLGIHSNPFSFIWHSACNRVEVLKYREMCLLMLFPGPFYTRVKLLHCFEDSSHNGKIRRIEMNRSLQFKQLYSLFLCPNLLARKGTSPKPIQDLTSNQKLWTSIGRFHFLPLSIPLDVEVSKAEAVLTCRGGKGKHFPDQCLALANRKTHNLPSLFRTLPLCYGNLPCVS